MLCVGGATVDRRYRLAAPLRPATSNPATGRRGFGGVARNVAETLARLGAEVGLLSRVGDDPEGRALVAALRDANVDAGSVEVVRDAATAEYAAVLGPAGDLAVGIADMGILDGLTPAMLTRHASLFAAADWVFADCNLPPAALAWLVRRAPEGARYRLAIDPVSVAKSGRLGTRLAGIDLLVLNRDEARAILDRRGAAPMGPTAEAEALRGAGARHVVLTLGPDGAVTTGPGGTTAIEALPARVVDVTGAGDSLIAGLLVGLMHGASLADAARLGCRAAARTVACTETVSVDIARVLSGWTHADGRAAFHKTVLPDG